MVTQVMVSKSSILVKRDREKRLSDAKDDHVADEFARVDATSDPRGSGEPYVLPDAKNWNA